MAARPEGQTGAWRQSGQVAGPSGRGAPQRWPSTLSKPGRLLSLVAGLAFVVFLACAGFALASLTGSLGLGWAAAGVIIALAVVTVAVSAHAGGHAWFVPAPGAALAVAWLVTASGPTRHASAWWLLAASAAFSGVAVLMAASVLRARATDGSMPAATLVGAEGTVVSAVAPVGIVRVHGESWTAESISGPLAVGATVHVVRLQGLRLVVWSDEGRVLGLEPLPGALDI